MLELEKIFIFIITNNKNGDGLKAPHLEKVREIFPTNANIEGKVFTSSSVLNYGDYRITKILMK